MYSIGDEVICYYPLKSGLAELVDIFPKGIVPEEALVTAYYGSLPIPKSCYGATQTDRYIFKRSGGGYVIVPEPSLYMIRKVSK